MRKERMICGVMMGLIMNWMIHKETGAVIYFSALMIGCLTYYCKIHLDRAFESALVRFVMILSVSLIFSKEMMISEAFCWMMICAASSALNQRVQMYESSFLDCLSIFNMILMPVVLGVVLMSLSGSHIGISVLIGFLAMFQPSGLPFVSPILTIK